MSEETLSKIVHIWSKTVADLKPYPETVTAFVHLIEKVDGLSGMERRFHREGMSLYHAISKNRPMAELEDGLSSFFESAPIPAGTVPGESESQGVSAQHMGGVQPEQQLFIKKVGEAEFYGALWPWKDKENVITVHLGVCAPGMTDENHQSMYAAVKAHLTESASTEIDADVTGRIEGVSLSSFLQMSEMDGSTYTLTVRSGEKSGTLHLLNGNLIDAETDDLRHREAAFTILSWENTQIDIKKPSGRQKNEIGLPLMQILMEALKEKDEIEYEKGTPSGAFEIGPDTDQSQDSLKKSRQRKKRSPNLKQSGFPGKQKRGARIAIAVAVILVLCVGTFFVMKGIGGRSVEDEYTALLAAVERLKDAEGQEKLIDAFIETHKADEVFTGRAVQRLIEIWGRMEASDYDDAGSAVFDLPLNTQYYRKAEEIFSAFLEKHPENRYHPEISKQLAEILDLTDDTYFSELGELDAREHVARLEAYRAYLAEYPDGRHRAEVEQLFREALKSSYRDFLIEIERCKRKEQWDVCVSVSRKYKAVFGRYMRMNTVDEIEEKMQEQKALAVLRSQTDGAEDKTVRKYYLAFLEKYPDSSEKKRLEQRVAEIDKEITVRNEWTRLKIAGMDSTVSLSYRVEQLRRYIDRNPGGPYMIEAENLLWKLEQPTQKGTLPAKKAVETSTQTTAVNNTEASAGQAGALHLETLRRKVVADLASTKNRYAARQDNSVVDNFTGLVWTMLDSYQTLGRCADYREAVKYVQQLKDGGHSDWRLPTSAELAGIYQNSPYFPASGAAWYWSSEVYAKGYQTIANIVSAKPDTEYHKKTAVVDKCGFVHAVRP
ncbi:MAG: DUF4388 domain-containing protein [Deltaproteobacteria bacterium]|nr:DUF4388 domain-containing protein [Deltaproteobacteria bacterium]